jgi:hypothetical protein
MIALEVLLNLLRRRLRPKACGKLGRDNHLIAVVLLLHPLSDPLLGFFTLVVVGGIDEVTALLVEVVEHGEGRVFVALAEEGFPGFAEVHGAEA